MSSLPLRFGENSFSFLDRTSFSYSFDKITAMTFNENTELPFNQNKKIPAIGIELQGRSANPNMSISLNGVTTLYNIQQLFISSHHPIVRDNAQTSKYYSLVIQGYSNQSVQTDKIFIFIPIDPYGITETKPNLLDTLNMYILKLDNDNNDIVTDNTDGTKQITMDTNEEVNINNLIPDERFYLYQKIDNNSTKYTVLFFDTSKLFTTNITKAYLDRVFRTNSAEIIYDSESTSFEDADNNFLLYKATVLPRKQASISTSFEDNIYIDCQPIDLKNEETQYYFQKIDGYGDYIQMGFVYLFTIVFISILVYFIYNIKNMFKTSTEVEVSKINETIKQFSKRII